MKRNFSCVSSIAYSILTLTLINCNGGDKNQKSQEWQPVSSEKSTPSFLLQNICGDDGVDKFVIQEASGEVLNTKLSLGSSKGVRAVVECVNKSSFDVTSAADWSSSNHDAFTVNNKNSKGYITTNNVGNGYLSATYSEGKFSAKYELNVTDAELTKITLSLGRSDNKIASGETVSPLVEGTYSNGSHGIVSNVILTSDNESVLKINGNSITALKPGSFNLTAKSNSLSSTINGQVLSAQPIGLVIDPSQQTNFITGIPQNVNYKAKILLSDQSLIDIPQNTFDNPSSTGCSLQKLPNDKNTPFVQTNAQNGCSINSTSESGENKLSYKYNLLNQDGSVKQKFESSVIIRSTDDQISSLNIELDQDLQNGGMIVGEIYRYHVYATLKNGNKIDVTKVIPLKTSLDYSGVDNTNKLLVSDTGYVGSLSSATDDGKGGVIKLTDYIVKDDLSNKIVNLKLTAQLTKFNANIDKQITIMPNTLSVKQISSYFAESFYPLLNSVDKRRFRTISGVDSKGNIIETTSSFALINLKDDQLYASSLDNTSLNNALTVSAPNNSVDVGIDVTIPRINKVYGSDDPDLSSISILCNNSNSNQTLSSVEKSKNITDTSTISRSLTVGVEQSIELDANYFNTVGVKSTTKFSLSGTRTWSDTHTTTNNYRLPPQNVVLESHQKAVVVQKVFKSLLGYTGKFELPLTENSCLPFMINGKPSGFTLSSPACMRYAEIGEKPNQPLFNRLFSGNNSLTFYTNYASDTGNNNVDTNTVAVYVYSPGDFGYESLRCENNSIQSTKSLNTTLTKNTLTIGEQNIKLSPKNLVKIKTSTN